MKVVFWWNIPCTGMINVLKAYCEVIDQTAIVVTGALSNSRKAMGWDDKGKLFDSHIVLNDEEWDTMGEKILVQYSDRLHVFNGITHPDRIKRLINYAIEKNIRFCNMCEAYSNLSFGFKRLVKSLYIKFYLPIIVRQISHHSEGVLCLSGKSPENLKQFEHLGFRKDKIYPYGYYTDENSSYQFQSAQDGKVHILCPGLLEKYKGVNLLIKALHIINDRGIKNFVCHITGKGSQEGYLKSLVKKFNLDGSIIFEGVLNSTKYNDLLSHIDILVAPGIVEPWGIRINEAIQRGNAVIVSNGLGAAELINISKGGAVFQTGDVEDLASKLQDLIYNNKALLRAKQNNIDYKSNISCRHQAEILSSILRRIEK